MTTALAGPTGDDDEDRNSGSSNTNTPKPPLNREKGVPNDFFWTQMITPTKFEVFNWDEDPADASPSLSQLQAMRKTDGQVRALYKLLTMPIRAALNDLKVVAAEGGEAEAEFIENMLKLPKSQGGMEVPLMRITAQLLAAVYDGFAAFEMVYQSPEKGPLKGKYTLKKLAYRPANTVTFITGLHGEFKGIRQKTFFHNKVIDVIINADDVIYYAAQEEEREFYGVSYFQSAWYHWDKKVRYYLAANLAANSAAMGTRVGKVPASASQTQRNGFAKQLADFGASQWIMIPAEGFEVDVHQERTGYDFMAYINHHNNQMSKSVLMPWFDSSQGSSQGDASAIKESGQSDIQDNAYLAELESIIDEILQILNDDLIPKFIDWNFSSDKYPTIEVNFNDEQEKFVRELFVGLMAGNTTPEFFRELEKRTAEALGMMDDIDYDEIEAREKEALEREAYAAEQQITAADQSLEANKAPSTLDEAVTQTVTGAGAKPAAGPKPAGPKPPAKKPGA